MDKLEYIPGDLCIVKGKVESVCEVDRDNDFSITTDQHPFIRLSEVKPIPLTPEILEKNGWKKDDRGYSFRDIIFLNKDDFGGWAIGIGDDYILTIASIHQLQHLLFGLGLNHEMEV